MDGKLYYSFKPRHEAECPLLRARELVPRARTGRLVREGAEGLGLGLEDPVLPPPAVLVGRAPRFRHAAARASRAAVPEIQRQRRADRPRSFLRADQAAERDRLLRVRVGRPAAEGEHRQEHRSHGGRQRSGSGLHDGGDQRRRDVVQRHLAAWGRCSTAGSITRRK